MEDLEYPKLDRGLSLLMLMHRWLEEVWPQVESEPRLEFYEEQSQVQVRVRGATVTQDLIYERPESTDVLRGLEADGYVELHRQEDAAGPPAVAGTITITERGLERIRHRRAFVSNLPRSFKRWEVSLIGSPRHIGVWKEWRANWEGRSITVENAQRIFLGRRRSAPTFLDEALYIDKHPAPRYRVVRSRFAKDLYGELRARDGVHEVHAHIGLTRPLLETGCLIAVDRIVIGGDVGKRFLT